MTTSNRMNIKERLGFDDTVEINYDDLSGSPINTPVVRIQSKDLPFQANEAINTLRANIQLSGYDIKVVGITSAVKHEGKSSLSFQLAKSFAGLGKKTVYVDCDIRNSHTMARLKISRRMEGLSGYLCGRAELADINYRTNIDNLNMIFTGENVPNPSELFSEERFKRLMSLLRESYDYVIVDTPPINAVIDGVLILKECDGAVMVVESGVTDRNQAVRAKQQLEYAQIRIFGAVLNKLGTRKSGYGYGRYGYGYGYGKYGKYGYGKYGYGYGYGNTDEDKKKKKQS